MDLDNINRIGGERIVRVRAPDNILNNLDNLTVTLKDVLGKLGCAACCSGFDIRFVAMRDFLAIEKNGRIATTIVAEQITP